MFFGPAADPMRKYWTKAEALWCNMDVKKRGVSDGLNEKLYTPEALNELKGYLEEAASLAPAGSDYAARVKAVQKQLYPYIDIVVNAKSKLPVMTVPQTATAPTIDGDRDALWDKAPTMTRLNNQDGTAAVVATTARVLCDKDNLYLFVECAEPGAKNLNAACTVHDCPVAPFIWDDDSIEIFISPDSRVAGLAVQIIANANGTIWDGCYNYTSFPRDKTSAYESRARCKAAILNDKWTLEMAIPLEKLSIDGIHPTKEWRFNLCRNRFAAGIDSKTREAYSWSPTRDFGWFIPNRFGFLKF